MNYQITSDNIDLSSSMEALAREKFERLEKRTRDENEETKHARVVLNSAPDGKFLVKAKFHVGDKEYFSNETDFTLEGALIKIVEEIWQMMEKDKSIREREMKSGQVKDLLDEGN